MAKKQELATAATPDSAVAVAAAPVDPSIPTPENTPVPGGGRWRWDITKPGWVEIDENGVPIPPAADPAKQPADLATQADPV